MYLRRVSTGGASGHRPVNTSNDSESVRKPFHRDSRRPPPPPSGFDRSKPSRKLHHQCDRDMGTPGGHYHHTSANGLNQRFTENLLRHQEFDTQGTHPAINTFNRSKVNQETNDLIQSFLQFWQGVHQIPDPSIHRGDLLCCKVWLSIFRGRHQYNYQSVGRAEQW